MLLTSAERPKAGPLLKCVVIAWSREEKRVYNSLSAAFDEGGGDTGKNIKFRTIPGVFFFFKKQNQTKITICVRRECSGPARGALRRLSDTFLDLF